MLTGLYAKAIMAAVIAAAVLSAVWYVNSLKSEIKELTANNIILKGNQERLIVEVKTQNNAVDAFKQDADARLAAAAKDLETAKAATKAAKGKATVIYKQAPTVPGTSCEADRSSALNLINGVAK